MAKNTQVFIKPGKSDLIEGILLGNKKQINAFKTDNKETKPSVMMGRLNIIAKNCSDQEIVKHAKKAVELLQKFSSDDSLTESQRFEILKEITKS